MPFEVDDGSKMQAVEFQDGSLYPWSLHSRHKRSKSNPEMKPKKFDWGISPQAGHDLKLSMEEMNGLDSKERPSSGSIIQSSLKQEIQQLEKHLQDQFADRQNLEKALGYRCSSKDISIETSMSKPTKELIKEISSLELEVSNLEQYLLSLYRKAFDQQNSFITPTSEERLNPHLVATGQSSRLHSESATSFQSAMIGSMWESHSLGSIDKYIKPKPIIPRSQSSLSQHFTSSSETCSSVKISAEGLQECHSQPLAFKKIAKNDARNDKSLVKHRGVHILDFAMETPNRISEQMIRYMGSIYYKLAESPILPSATPMSPTSSFSSISTFSPHLKSDLWSPQYKKDYSSDDQLERRFKIGLKECSGPHSRMVEIHGISRERKRITGLNIPLQEYRSLVAQLDRVDPRSMKNEEKLAFWINVHNALVMHAYLVEGIPRNSLKKGLLLAKAAYNIGGQVFTADTIQSLILRCHVPRPGKWLRSLFFPKTKFKNGDVRQSYAIQNHEPLLIFALSSGSRSDPAVRVYTAKRVFDELETAKEQFIKSLVILQKENRILLPKIMEAFAKDLSLRSSDTLDMIQRCLPVSQQKAMKKWQEGKTHINIEWMPHNFGFRYLLSKDLVE